MSLHREITAAAQRQAIVTVEGLDLVWTSMSGGGVTLDYTLDESFGAEAVMAGAVRAEPIVLTTTISPQRDLGWMRAVKKRLGRGRYTIVRQWTDPNWGPVGDPEVYADCLLIGYTNPESSPSAEDAVFTLTFATTGESL